MLGAPREAFAVRDPVLQARLATYFRYKLDVCRNNNSLYRGPNGHNAQEESSSKLTNFDCVPDSHPPFATHQTTNKDKMKIIVSALVCASMLLVSSGVNAADVKREKRGLAGFFKKDDANKVQPEDEAYWSRLMQESFSVEPTPPPPTPRPPTPAPKPGECLVDVSNSERLAGCTLSDAPCRMHLCQL